MMSCLHIALLTGKIRPENQENRQLHLSKVKKTVESQQ